VLRFSLLGSGSSGNAALVQAGETILLLDCGLAYKHLEERAASVGIQLSQITAVLITHEHGDHIKSLGTLTRRLGIPVYITPETYRAVAEKLGEIPGVCHFEAGDRWTIGDIEVLSIQVNHDAVDPVAFSLHCGPSRMAFVTDVGHCSHLIRNRLTGMHALVMESNYCPDMLRNGSYPPQVQQRIRSRNGHLSNHDMASLLDDLVHDQLQTVVLVHISERNNEPELVRRLAKGVLKDHPAELVLATQDAPTAWFEVRA
jgi:phosphoribosyl 1,2-cyclic phosphodiesterase